MAAAKGDHMDRSLQDREDGREGEKEGEEGGPATDGRGSPTDAGEVRCDLVWWRLDPFLDPSFSTSPLPNTEEEGWLRKRARTRGLKRVFVGVMGHG